MMDNCKVLRNSNFRVRILFMVLILYLMEVLVHHLPHFHIIQSCIKYLK